MLNCASNHRLSVSAIWAQVIVAPEDNKIDVLSKGTSKGLIGSIPVGGQIEPTSTLGLKAEWKKAQKNAKKKNTSEQINKSIPIRMPLSTFAVCLP